jgi:hypothetical protein
MPNETTDQKELNRLKKAKAKAEFMSNDSLLVAGFNNATGEYGILYQVNDQAIFDAVVKVLFGSLDQTGDKL